MNIDSIRTYSDDLLQTWLEELEGSGHFQLPGIPFNYYEISNELDRRKEKEN